MFYRGWGMSRVCTAGQADIDIAAVVLKIRVVHQPFAIVIGNGGEDLDIMKGAVGGRVGKDPADGKRGLVTQFERLADGIFGAIERDGGGAGDDGRIGVAHGFRGPAEEMIAKDEGE